MTILFIIALLLCLDLFISKGRPSTFDGPTHLANIAQFHKALKSGDFPVRWMDGFGNYGMPTGIIVQQTTTYLGALLTFLTHDIFLSYNLVFLIGAFLSLYFLLDFLRLHFNEEASLLAVILFNFSPYRIINIYIRGALPEFFSHVFFPIIFIGLNKFLKQKKTNGLIYILVGFVGILLTHPFTLIVGAFIWVPYALFLIWGKDLTFIKKNVINILLTGLFILGISAYYIIPLSLEIKYFYYGNGSHFLPGNHLTLVNYIGDKWFYFYNNDIEVRGQVIHLGLLESIVMLFSFFYLIFSRGKDKGFLKWLWVSFIILVFFTSRFADSLYRQINLLGNIQHNWRMFTSIVFIAPLALAFLGTKIKSKVFFMLVILVIALFRFPQLYGKNYVLESQSKYYWTKLNLHGNIMNTIWTGPTQDYPVKKVKGEIIAGKGVIIKRTEQNSWRKYEIQAFTDVRLVDYTFYFPGWKVFVDKKEVPVEFQDMNYRGVITYNVPKGTHEIIVKFTDTKVRRLANLISLISIGILGILLVFRKRLFGHPSKKSS